ncbi:chitobiase/beta-hexosaminidase C-terminal domain-containing protein [candidate division KSB1 bacterium]|nr:chitobiase/beta-hexosaminidase C-terminal domain-containing protein [candidate division KSB1 bacterium]
MLNHSDCQIITPEPIFSLRGGFYEKSQFVSFENVREVEIYYTVDSSPPNSTSQRFDTPILISETTALRAIAYQDGKLPSEIITNTYFINSPVNLPVLSLATDPDNFFDEEIGIYVTGINGTGGYCAGVIRKNPCANKSRDESGTTPNKLGW